MKHSDTWNIVQRPVCNNSINFSTTFSLRTSLSSWQVVHLKSPPKIDYFPACQNQQHPWENGHSDTWNLAKGTPIASSIDFVTKLPSKTWESRALSTSLLHLKSSPKIGYFPAPRSRPRLFVFLDSDSRSIVQCTTRDVQTILSIIFRQEHGLLRCSLLHLKTTPKFDYFLTSGNPQRLDDS